MPQRDDRDQQRVIAAVLHWLTTHDRWLLIYDNVEDLSVLEHFLPLVRHGSILLTTRLQTLGIRARGIPLLPMEDKEGIFFLLRRAKVLQAEATDEQVRQLAVQLPAQYKAAAELVTAMGGLPLALDQAGAYLEETQCGLPAYLEIFHSRRAILLQQRGEGLLDHPLPVSTTFILAITEAAQRHPAIWDLLRVCALLQPDTIPDELFRQGAKHLGAMLEAASGDPLEWNQVVAIVCSYSLLSRQPEAQAFSIHRLVQAVLWDTMTEVERKEWDSRVVSALDTIFPEEQSMTEYATWKERGERLLPHALICIRRVGDAEDSLPLASLAYKAAHYLHERGQYVEAEPLLQHALHIRKHVLEPNHPLIATSLNYLADLYWFQGRYTEAEPLFQRALTIREQFLGLDNPDLAQTLNDLALLYWSQGKYTEAEPLYQHALLIWEQIRGPDHPNTTYTLNNLAELYRSQGRFTEAKSLFLRALQIREQWLGPNHPDVATVHYNLAELYREQCKYVEASTLYQRALMIREQYLSPAHPLVAESLHGLANLCRDQARYAEAEAYYQQALSIREQQLGQQHPETAQTLHDMAIFSQKQGDLGKALSFAERALKIRSLSLGEAHPKTEATRALYAQLVQE